MITILTGVGTPEGIVTASIGDFYVNTENATVYVKMTDDSTSGWAFLSHHGFIEGDLDPRTSEIPAVRGVIYYNPYIANKQLFMQMTESTQAQEDGWVLFNNVMQGIVDPTDVSTDGTLYINKATFSLFIFANSTWNIIPLLIPDENAVFKNLSELLTNSVDMADKFYEIFLDENPHMVTLEMYGKDGILQSMSIPNRALDKTIAYSGIGSPESIITATSGALYVDLNAQQLYIKTTASGDLGWLNITPQPITTYREEHQVDHLTTSITLHNVVQKAEDINIYLNGVLLNKDEYDLDTNGQTVSLYPEIPDSSIIQVQYFDGLYGIKGDTALTFTVGNVETLDSDTPAYVHQNGTAKDIVLDYGIPQGAKGESGVWMGPDEPTDPDYKVWIDSTAVGTTEQDYAAMRVWDTYISTSPKGYCKILNLKHSAFSSDKFSKIGEGVTINDINGLASGFTKSSYVTIPSIQLSKLKGNSWFIETKFIARTDAFNPIIDLSQGWHAWGSVSQSINTLYFSARTGKSGDVNNEGIKIRIPYVFVDGEIYYARISFDIIEGRYELTLYNKDKEVINKKNWLALVDEKQTSQELYYFSTNPNHAITLGAYPIDSYTSGCKGIYLGNTLVYVNGSSIFSCNPEGSDSFSAGNKQYTIPYTRAITGAKIVDASYRNDLLEIYNYTGKGNYYTIDEVEETFTLPWPDIYGMLANVGGGATCTLRIWSDD